MVEQTANTGIVYILSNVAMPGYLKIGQTSGDSSDDVQQRMRELYNHTGVPRTFNCEYAAVVNDYKNVEQTILYAFDHLRVNPNREFLEGIDPVRVRAILELSALKEVTPNATSVGYGESSENEKPPRAERFKFSMVGISIGSFLEWADDRKEDLQGHKRQ